MRPLAAKSSIRIALAAFTCVAVVATAHAQIFAGKKEILRQSRYQWLDMKKHLPLTPNPRVQNYVECVANRIINVIGDEYADLSWEVVVFDDDALNAFAMPGGKIGVYTGILNVADTPESLAAVLGHEVAHLTSDHVMERASRQKKTEALVLLGGAATGLGGMVRDGTTVFFTLPFGREQESEADGAGLEYMAAAGFDPRASLYLWKSMSGAKEGKKTAEFLSTHPSDDRRMTDLVRLMTPALVKYNDAREAGIRPNCQL